MAKAGVSNVTAGVADGEVLTGFGDESVDAVTCTWGLIFMPQWQQALQVQPLYISPEKNVIVRNSDRKPGSSQCFTDVNHRSKCSARRLCARYFTVVRRVMFIFGVFRF